LRYMIERRQINNVKPKSEIMKKIIIFLALSAAGFFFITSCENLVTDQVTEEEGLTMAEEEIEVTKSLEAVEQDVDAARFAAHYPGPYEANFRIPKVYLGNNFPDCADVTVDRDSFPKTVTIIYGEDCLNRHGRPISGTVILELTDSVTLPGSTYTAEYIDLMIGQRLYNMVAEFTNEGQNEAGNWIVSSVANITISVADTLLILRDFAYQKEWLEGFGTRHVSDNKFLKTGSGIITVNEDMVFEREIIDPLLVDRACRFILSGVVEITKNGESMIIDYGDGECDNLAVVTKDGESEEIELISGKFKRKIERKIRNMHKRNGWW